MPPPWRSPLARSADRRGRGCDAGCGAGSPQGKLNQTVEITDAGVCRKRIKVTVERADIEARMTDHFKKLGAEAVMTGFRPGKAPRKLVEKRYAKEVTDQVKNEVLYASLDQLGTDNDISPLSQPEIDPAKIEIPKEGPMVYEFEVEVRPTFDVPNYRGLKLKRPVKKFTDADVDEAHRQAFAPYSSRSSPKRAGPSNWAMSSFAMWFSGSATRSSARFRKPRSTSNGNSSSRTA